MLEHMQFCLVPAGPFWMGSPDSDDEAYPDERPEHLNEELDYDYWLSHFPITVAQYQLFVNATSHQPTDPRCLKDPANRPVRYVTWREAIKFCDWLTQHWRQQGLLPKQWRVQLPSEAEWEKAARGGLKVPQPAVVRPIRELIPRPPLSLIDNEKMKRRFPWGDNADANRANYDDTKIGNTSAVGCFPGGQSPYGCEEMAGNVREWCRTKWRDDYKQPADDRFEGDEGRVVRGGSFILNQRGVRCSNRGWDSPYGRIDFIGFRVVLSP